MDDPSSGVTATVRELLGRRPCRVALVGASNARFKYGNIILRNLLAQGFDVLPVNPGQEQVHGIACRARVDQGAAPVDIVNVVVPPERAMVAVADTDPAVCDVIWFQPGSFDAETLTAARERFGTVIAGPCIMVEARGVRP